MSVTQLVRGTQLKPGTVKTLVYNAATTGVMSDLAAITASKALASDANGLPVASATTATELGYVSGVTSAIQAQINTLTSGLSWKTASRVASTVDIPGSDNAGTITVDKDNATYFPTGGKGIFVDGIELAVNDRVLVKSQSLSKQNGIYSVSAVGLKTTTDAVLVRASDMNIWAEVPSAATFVSVGTVNADLGFVCTSDAGGTLDTTAITFVQFSTYAAGITQLTGEVTAGPGSGSQAATVTNSAVIGKVITGYVSGAGTVADTDTILAAINKLNGNTAAKVAKAGDTMTGALTIDPVSDQLVLGGVSAGFKVTITSPAPAANRVLTIPIATGDRNFLISGEAQIVAADISATAAIALTQLAAMTSGNIIVGSAGTVPTSVTMSADATIIASGALTIASNFLKDSRVATREVPTGDIDGLNCLFTLAVAPTSGTECVFLNGLLQNEGAGNDYTIDTKYITFNSVAATPSGTITYGSPSNGDTVVLTGLPNSGGTKTYTKAAAGSGTEFSTIAELTALIDGLSDVSATDNGTVITIVVVTKGTQMNSATVTGTGAYSALSITFSGGTTNAPQTGSDVLVNSNHA